MKQQGACLPARGATAAVASEMAPLETASPAHTWHPLSDDARLPKLLLSHKLSECAEKYCISNAITTPWKLTQGWAIPSTSTNSNIKASVHKKGCIIVLDAVAFSPCWGTHLEDQETPLPISADITCIAGGPFIL